MGFVVEDGTGRADATSLVSLEKANTYWTDRPLTTGGVAWNAISTAERQERLIVASDYIRNQKRYRWRGTKKTYAQRMPFPRTGLMERDGQEVPDNVVPHQVEEAVMFLAARAVAEDLQPDLERGGRVASVGVAGITQSFEPGAPVGTLIQHVDGLLAPLLRGGASDEPLTIELAQADYPSAFDADHFDNGSSGADSSAIGANS